MITEYTDPVTDDTIVIIDGYESRDYYDFIIADTVVFKNLSNVTLDFLVTSTIVVLDCTNISLNNTVKEILSINSTYSYLNCNSALLKTEGKFYAKVIKDFNNQLTRQQIGRRHTNYQQLLSYDTIPFLGYNLDTKNSKLLNTRDGGTVDITSVKIPPELNQVFINLTNDFIS